VLAPQLFLDEGIFLKVNVTFMINSSIVTLARTFYASSKQEVDAVSEPCHIFTASTPRQISSTPDSLTVKPSVDAVTFLPLSHQPMRVPLANFTSPYSSDGTFGRGEGSLPFVSLKWSLYRYWLPKEVRSSLGIESSSACNRRWIKLKKFGYQNFPFKQGNNAAHCTFFTSSYLMTNEEFEEERMIYMMGAGKQKKTSDKSKGLGEKVYLHGREFSIDDVNGDLYHMIVLKTIRIPVDLLISKLPVPDSRHEKSYRSVLPYLVQNGRLLLDPTEPSVVNEVRYASFLYDNIRRWDLIRSTQDILLKENLPKESLWAIPCGR
jgi:hypothetical protein